MKSYLIIYLILVLSLFSCKKDETSPSNPDPSNTLIYGRVYLDDTYAHDFTVEKGIPVTLTYNGTAWNTETDSFGVFRFENMKQGTYTINISRKDFVPITTTFNTNGENLVFESYSLNKKSSLDPKTITLSQDGTFSNGLLYITTNFYISKDTMEKVRVFYNKGKYVSTDHYLMTFVYGADYPLFSFPKSNFNGLGLKKGDTLSAMIMGDNDPKLGYYKNSEVTSFPYASDKSSNTAYIILE